MSVIAAHLYKDGQRLLALALDGSDPASAAGEFVWIGLHDPSRREMDALGEMFGLHPLAVEDAFQLHQFPKVDVYGDKIFVVVRSTRLRQGVIIYAETHVFAGPGYIITVRHGDGPAHGQRAKLERDPELLAHGVDRVLHGVL
ncbi:MAG: magnesium transporter, partial [Caulobacteraceae bacterium]